MLYAVAGLPMVASAPEPAGRPNLLWIIAEDMGPWLGCYGEALARTPNIDALAAEGLRFTRAWAGGAACSPSRSTLFSGMPAVALGTETHREPRPVPSWAFFPRHLRAAGYYCTNNAKTDYNARPMGDDWWDASGRQAHYRNRPPGQPFFHCFSSLMETHMSCIINHPPGRRPDRRVLPEEVRLPAWLPDLPELRDDRAWHLDWIARMDTRVGEILAELERSGEAGNTIVFFFSDHGGCLPGGKGFAWNYGFHVPLVIRFPPRYAHLAPRGTRPGDVFEGLVSFLDFAPTVFELANTPAPAYLQGRPFAGPGAGRTPPRDVALAFRGINGGRWDPVRALRDERYLYVRNFLPHRPAGQRQDYQWRMPGQQAWELAYRDGRCDALQSRFWQPRLPEELYDLAVDPEQTRNLADDPGHAAALERLRRRLREELETAGDIAFTPNSLRSPGAAVTFYDRMASQPQEAAAVRAAAWAASDPGLSDAAPLAPLAASSSAAVRYWAGAGLARLAYAGRNEPELRALARTLLADKEAQVRVAAAEAAVRFQGDEAALALLIGEIRERPNGAGREALAALETLGPIRASAAAAPLAEFNRQRSTFFLRSALITLGGLPYSQLFPPGSSAEE